MQTTTNPGMSDLKIGDRVKVAIESHGFIRGQVTNISGDGVDIKGQRGGAACLIMHADGYAWGMKGIGSMSPKAGRIEFIERA